MISISTKTGDSGESGLANGQRIDKDELIFEVLGTQDELNSWIGFALGKLSGHFQKQKKFLLEVQDTLFYIGAELARSPKAQLKKSQLTKLETKSEDLQEQMGKGWTTKFLYPGGNESAAILDITRTISRRLERLVVHYAKKEETSPLILQYLNRLSDYLFVLRCYVNWQENYQEKKFLTNDSYVKKLRKNLTKK